MLSIYVNGSSSVGNDTRLIESLLDVLKKEPLDKNFENFGNFIENQQRTHLKSEDDASEYTVFFGSFRYFSYPFRVVTDEPKLIETLTEAIRNNQETFDYINQEIACTAC